MREHDTIAPCHQVTTWQPLCVTRGRATGARSAWRMWCARMQSCHHLARKKGETGKRELPAPSQRSPEHAHPTAAGICQRMLGHQAPGKLNVWRTPVHHTPYGLVADPCPACLIHCDCASALRHATGRHKVSQWRPGNKLKNPQLGWTRNIAPSNHQVCHLAIHTQAL
jgi:hypothetical protein